MRNGPHETKNDLAALMDHEGQKCCCQSDKPVLQILRNVRCRAAAHEENTDDALRYQQQHDGEKTPSCQGLWKQSARHPGVKHQHADLLKQIEPSAVCGGQL